MTLLAYVGTKALETCERLGSFALFIIRVFGTLFSSRLNIKQLFINMKSIGADSSIIISLTGFSAGLALAFQTNMGLSRFGTQDFIGVIVALGMTRELGPVLTGLMITGRSGSAIAAELGTMRISEQIDALRTVCINPFQYLIVPRVIACILMLPLLATISMLCGIFGGYLFCVHMVDINPEVYISVIRQSIELSDISGGLIKSSFFGLIISLIATFQGYYTTGGARGVGISTTRTVVLSSIMILITNYFLSAFLDQIGFS